MDFEEIMLKNSFWFAREMVLKAAHDIVDFDDSCETAVIEFTGSDYFGDRILGCRVFSLIGKYTYAQRAVYFTSWGMVHSEFDKWKSGAFFISISSCAQGERYSAQNVYRYSHIKNTPHDSLEHLVDSDPLQLRAELYRFRQHLREWIAIPPEVRPKLIMPEPRPEYLN